MCAQSNINKNKIGQLCRYREPNATYENNEAEDRYT